MLEITKDYRNIEYGWVGGFSEPYAIYLDYLHGVRNRKGIDKDWTTAITEKNPVYVNTIFAVLDSYNCDPDEFAFKVIPSYEDFQSRYLNAATVIKNNEKENCRKNYSVLKESLSKELEKLTKEKANKQLIDYQKENEKLISSFASNIITGYNSLDEEIINTIEKVLKNYDKKVSVSSYTNLIDKNVFENPRKLKEILSNEKIEKVQDLHRIIDEITNKTINDVFKKHNELADEYNGLEQFFKKIDARIDKIKIQLNTLDDEQKQALDKIENEFESSMSLEYQHLNFFAQFKGSEIKKECGN